MNRKGQTGGLITGLIFGIASLVIGVIIAFTITSTLSSSNLLTAGRTTQTVNNESGWVNSTGYTLTGASNDYVYGSFSITILLNATDNSTIDVGNASVTSDGIVYNASATEINDALITYTYSLKSSEELSTEHLSTNFTKGIENVSSKIPTILLVAAIVLIIGVLAILVGVWQRMRMGGQQL